MQTKQMRILIADASDELRFGVERLLNHMGCFGVAVAGTIEELNKLMDFPGRPFDLVLVNCNLLDHQQPAVLQGLQNKGNVVLYRNGFFSGRLADPLAHISEGLCGMPKSVPTLH